MKVFGLRWFLFILCFCCGSDRTVAQIEELQKQLDNQLKSQTVFYQDTFEAEITLHNTSSQDLELSMNLGNAQYQQYEIRYDDGEEINLYTGQYMPRNRVGELRDYEEINFLIEADKQVHIKIEAWNQTKDDLKINPHIRLRSNNVVTLIKWFRISPLGVVTSMIFLGGVFMFMIYFLAISIANPVDYRWYYTLHLLFAFIFYLVYLDHVFQINYLFPNNSLFAAKIIEFIRIPVLFFYLIFFIKILGLKKKTLKVNSIFLIGILLIYIWSIWFSNDLSFALNKIFFLYLLFFVISTVSNYKLYKVWRGQIKNYIIPGSIIFGLCVLPEAFHLLSSDRHYDLEGFYINSIKLFSFNFSQLGILISLIFFSIAIGYKQREILLDRNLVQEKFIGELEKNKALQEQLNQNLRSEIKVTTDQLTKKEAEVVRSEYENRILQLESELLSSQMSPHFIFNSLNSVKYYALTKPAMETANFVTSFAKLMRIILNNSRKKKITISEEVEFLDMYLEVERKRFDKKFDYKIVVDRGLDKYNTHIPPMLLQPYIENSLWHGLLHKKTPGHILITMKVEGDDLLCVIEDNGIGREASTMMNRTKERNRTMSHGIAITSKRIEIINDLFDNSASTKAEDLYDENNVAAGTRITIQLPKMAI